MSTEPTRRLVEILFIPLILVVAFVSLEPVALLGIKLSPIQYDVPVAFAHSSEFTTSPEKNEMTESLEGLDGLTM